MPSTGRDARVLLSAARGGGGAEVDSDTIGAASVPSALWLSCGMPCARIIMPACLASLRERECVMMPNNNNILYYRL